MKRNHILTAGLIAAVTLAGSAYAQGWGMPGGGCDATGYGPGGQKARHAGKNFDPAQRVERHLGVMKDTLKITAEQEPLWLAYAEKMKEGAGKGMQAFRNQATDEKLTAPERMAKMQGLMEQHLAAAKDKHESFNRLYAALTPEQKAAADQLATRMGKGGMGGKPSPGGAGGPGRVMPPARQG